MTIKFNSHLGIGFGFNSDGFGKYIGNSGITVNSINPTLWLEDDSQYMTFSSGALVERWNDIRGNGVYVENLNAGTQPTHVSNGNGVTFVNKTLTANFNQRNRVTTFIVGKSNNVASGGYFITSNEASPDLYYGVRHISDAMRTNFSDGVNTTQAITQPTDVTLKANFNLIFSEVEMGGSAMRKNGTYGTSHLYSRNNRPEVNFTPKLSGINLTTKAVIMFDRQLTNAERYVVEDYLAAKYSITLDARPATVVDGVVAIGDSTCRGNGLITQSSAYLQGVIPNAYIYDTVSTAIEPYKTIDADRNNMQPNNATNYFSVTDSIAYYGEQYVIKYGVGGQFMAVSWLTTTYNLSLSIVAGYIHQTNRLLELDGKILNVKAVVICLGDNDAANETYANAFATNLTNLVNRMNNLVPSTPSKIILRRPIDTNTGDYLSTVRAAIDNSGYNVLSTDDYNTLDGLHLDAAGDEALGLAISNLL